MKSEESKITFAEFGENMLRDFLPAEGENIPKAEDGGFGSVFGAEETEDVLFDGEEEIILEDTPAKKGKILFEDVSKRGENVKHFRMKDGSFMAAVYPKPVHYRDGASGEYREIYREFKETENNYEARNHNFRAVFPKKAGKRDYFRNTKWISFVCRYNFTELTFVVNSCGKYRLFFCFTSVTIAIAIESFR